MSSKSTLKNPKYQDFSDLVLIDAYKNGDKEAMGVLIERHSKYLSTGLFSLIRDPILLEDMIQETWIKVMEKLDSYKRDISFRAWVIQIAKNLYIDQYRRSKRKGRKIEVPEKIEEGQFFTILSPSERSPEQIMIDSEVDFDVNEVLSFLSKEQREVIVLRIFQDFSFKEIADYMGEEVSINTILGRMRYALINIRKILKEKGKI